MIFIYILAFYSFLVTLVLTIQKIGKQNEQGKKDSKRYLIALFTPLIIGIVISIFHSPSQKTNSITKKVYPKEVAAKESTSELQDSLELNFFDLDLHLSYIKKNFNKKYVNENTLAEIKNYYWYKSQSIDTNYQKISKWAQGVVFYYENVTDSAIHILKSHQNIKYSNLFLGNIYEKQRKYENASLHFYNEYLINKNIPDSILDLLIYRIINHQASKEIQFKVCYDDKLEKRLPNSIKIETFYMNSDWSSYAKIYFNNSLKTILVPDFFISIVVILMWIIYLFQLDIFQRENYKYAIFILLLSSLLTETVPFFYDFYEYSLGWTENNLLLNDFLYSIFCIGFIEEFIKLIPFFILIAFTKEPDESYDYLFYTSLCGLGFALMENSMYFNYYGGTTILSRAITSTVAHVFFSSLTAYGILYAKYFNKNIFLYGCLFFVLAIFAHGVYDWLLMFNFRFLFYLGFFATMMVWFIFINNSLNISSYFSNTRKINFKKVEYSFALFLAFILIGQYLLDQYFHKNENVLSSLWWSVFIATFFQLFFINRISKMDLVKGFWRKIDFRDNYNKTGKNSSFDPRVILVNFFMVNSINPKNYFGFKIRLFNDTSITKNIFNDREEFEAQIHERVCVNEYDENGRKNLNNEYFWVQINSVLFINNKVTNFLLAKQQDYYDSLESSLPVHFRMYNVVLDSNDVPLILDESSIDFLGYCFAQKND